MRRRYVAYTFEDAQQDLAPAPLPPRLAPRTDTVEYAWCPDEIVNLLIDTLEREYTQRVQRLFQPSCQLYRLMYYRLINRQWSRLIGNRVHQLRAPREEPEKPFSSVSRAFPHARIITLPKITDGPYAEALSNLIGAYSAGGRVFGVKMQHYHAGDGTVPVNVRGAYAFNGSPVSRYMRCLCVYRGTPSTNSCNRDWPESHILNISRDGMLKAELDASVTLHGLARILTHEICIGVYELSTAVLDADFAPGQFRAKQLNINFTLPENVAQLARIMEPNNWHNGRLPELLIVAINSSIYQWPRETLDAMCVQFPTANILFRPISYA